ncbi:uncharacterized protein isoform X1 [Rhodnius prolixus]|uniref:uncharacterized protein isoform X1 n=1 Tax=Rhodnius prolixus TaxID=13249 RepID=UPI003D187EB7
MVLKVVQANLHHAKAASAVVCRRFDSEGLDLALLQEPWYHGGFVRGLNPKLGKTLYSKSASRPRACIVLKYGIGCILIPELCSGDFVTALLNIITEGGPRKLVVCSAYFPGDEDCLPSLLGDIVAHCRRERLQLILGCDANAHNTAWGSTDDNARGTYISRPRRGAQLSVTLDAAEVEKRLVMEMGQGVCIYEDVCIKHANPAVRSEQIDWEQLFKHYGRSPNSKGDHYLLSVFMGDIVGSPALCKQLAKRGRSCYNNLRKNRSTTSTFLPSTPTVSSSHLHSPSSTFYSSGSILSFS